jgi:hypothetical protein
MHDTTDNEAAHVFRTALATSSVNEPVESGPVLVSSCRIQAGGHFGG